jgi:hypothetical protein
VPQFSPPETHILRLADGNSSSRLVVPGELAAIGPLTSASVTSRPRKTAIQPRISTIPCKILYSLANSVLPFRMFASPFPSLANRSPLFFSFFPVPNPFIIRTCANRACNSLRICTSKTQDLKPFRIRTYEKTGEGDPQPCNTATHHSPRPPEMPSSLCAPAGWWRRQRICRKAPLC